MTTTFDFSTLMLSATRPPAVMVRGRGSWLWDHTGKRYLDFVQGWAVNCLGHAHPVVLDALARQAAELIHASPAFHTAPALALARELTVLTGLGQAFFCSTGAEANEGAIKLARKWGALHRCGAFEIITAEHSFHGRTLATMAASGKADFAQRFPPTVPGFRHVPFGDAAAVEAAIGADTVAVMIEPVQGEGGVNVPAAGYLRALRELTERNGLLLIVDEIQTGMGRTGRLFACEHEQVTPDIMTLGKGLGGGLPLSALLAKRDVCCFAPGDQGGTFTGHPLTCAVGLAVLAELASPGFLEGVRTTGELLAAGLQRLASAHGCAMPHGVGLLWALPIARAAAKRVVEHAFADGLLVNAPRPDLLRFMPALNVSAADVEHMLERLDAALHVALT